MAANVDDSSDDEDDDKRPPAPAAAAKAAGGREHSTTTKLYIQQSTDNIDILQSHQTTLKLLYNITKLLMMTLSD